MPKLPAIFLTLAVTGCTSGLPRVYGYANQSAQEVSVQGLLGNPQEFDGKVVRVVGVAKFDFGFEGVSALYTSKDDLSHNSFGYIGIDSVAPILNGESVSLEALTGKFVLIEGVFHMVTRESHSVCIGKCWPTGYLSNVSRAQAW
jgi:hypothetical protein